ncbi:hypothetical protein GCM10011514_17020 [Emticicia aquatilis]|uniref:Uncharacterized protein n=1 Tax=Emticicia aquatilis TaxID=1537369 RepID=A0A917DN38_9BACT|nr:hypothetical protein [Emticicia aquatilis]GGD53479.1 hypothetical protein GCM10011514_17020 [Emticicia aquatilis]
MLRLEIPILLALYESVDSRKFEVKKSKFIFDWKKMKELETGKFPKTRDRIYSILKGKVTAEKYEYNFLNRRIQEMWCEVFGENNLQREIDNITAGFEPYKSRTLTEQDFS